VRIIAATHQNLEELVENGDFREDLFHRLNVIRIHIPALRERREDIPLLMQHFLSTSAKELGTELKSLMPETIVALQQIEWPGNVRQLENTARWLTVMSSGQDIHVEDLPPELKTGEMAESSSNEWQVMLRAWAQQKLQHGDNNILDEALPVFESTLIKVALEHTGGRRQDAARLLGWGRNTLTRKIKELNLSQE
jgi:two-component system nitrogen regulation response regulator GlnG